MVFPSELSLPFLMKRLEEELLGFQMLVKNLPNPPDKELLNSLLIRSLLLLQGGVTLFESLNSLSAKNNPPQEALDLAKNLIESVREFYTKLEINYPLFLDTITVFFEPLSLKLKHISKVLEEDVSQNIDFEELAEVLGEIISTLEVYFNSLQHLEDFES